MAVVFMVLSMNCQWCKVHVQHNFVVCHVCLCFTERGGGERETRGPQWAHLRINTYDYHNVD